MESAELIKRIEVLEAKLKTLEPSNDTQAVEEKAEEPIKIDVEILSKLKL